MAALRELAERNPQLAYRLIGDVTLRLVAELPEATGAWGRIEPRDYGRAHTLLDDAGILINQAARVLLGLPAAGPRAEREMVAQALAEPDVDPADRSEAAPPLPLPLPPDDDVWAQAVFQFRQRRPAHWS